MVRGVFIVIITHSRFALVRTPHIADDIQGTPQQVLSTYLCDAARLLLFGSEKENAATQQNAMLTSMKRRVPLVSIYIVSTNDEQLDKLATVMSEVPCRMYHLQGDDFFTKEEGRYDGIGIDRLANLRAAGDFSGFPVLVFDGGTAMTYTSADGDGKVLGGGIGPGVQVRLHSLSDYASALPHINQSELSKELASMTNEEGETIKTLPMFARTPQENIISSLCRDIASSGQSIIQGFLGKVGGAEPTNGNENGKDSPKLNASRTIHVTGGDADLIARLLTPDYNKLIELEPGKKISSPPQYEVKKMKHMIHYGIAGVLTRKDAEFREDSPATANLDALLIGQRIAKKFPAADADGDFVFRGVVSCIHKDPDNPYGIRYDDGDSEDFSVDELYGTSFCCMIGHENCSTVTHSYTYVQNLYRRTKIVH